MTPPNPAPATDYGELVTRLRADACLFDDGPISQVWCHEHATTLRAAAFALAAAQERIACFEQGKIPANWLAMHEADVRLNNGLRERIAALEQRGEQRLLNDVLDPQLADADAAVVAAVAHVERLAGALGTLRHMLGFAKAYLPAHLHDATDEKLQAVDEMLSAEHIGAALAERQPEPKEGV